MKNRNQNMKKSLFIILFVILTISCTRKAPAELVKENIKENDIAGIQKILDKNGFTQDEYNSFATLIYLKNKNLDLILKLIPHGLPVNTYCGNETLLQKAVLEQNLNTVKFLLSNNASVLMFDKSENNTALSLSIQQRGKNSEKIFANLFDNVSNTDFCKDDKEDLIIKNSVMWYYLQIIEQNQNNFLRLFLNNEFVYNEIINNKNTLSFVAKYRDMFCEENFSVLKQKLKIDENFEYYKTAIVNLNVDALKYLIKNNVPMKESINEIDSLLSSYDGNEQIQPALSASEEMLELNKMKPVLREYSYSKK